MNYSYSQEIKATYENFIAVCPICNHKNIFNRKTDLKTSMPITFKSVECFECKNNFNINGDRISEAHQYLILDVHGLKEQKYYMYCILNLAQAIESFLSHCIQSKLLYQPQRKGIISKSLEFNQMRDKLYKHFERCTFHPLRNIFFELYIKQKEFQDKEQIELFFKSLKSIKNEKVEHYDKLIDSYPNKEIAELFRRLRQTKVPDFRNKVVHKFSYRPTLSEVEDCLDETRHIVFKLDYHLNDKGRLQLYGSIEG
jgi:hypothetical protein